jgi:hypothetical protein
VLILRIRQAQCALADGRLQEAFAAACDRQVQAHHSGQRLVSQVLAALVQRGREHLAAQRLTDALADVERAGQLDRGKAEVAALREAVAAAIVERQRGGQRRQQAVALAQRCMQQGWFSGGAAALAQLDSGNPQRAEVEQAMAMEQARIEATLRQAEAALAGDQWAAAADLLASLSRHRLVHARAGELTGRLVQQGLDAVQAHIHSGRLTSAKAVLAAIGPLADQRPQAAEFQEALDTLAGAWRDLRRGQPQQAAHALRRLLAQWPEAAWLRDAAAAAQQAADGYNDLAGGPLGAAGGLDHCPARRRPDFPPGCDRSEPAPAPPDDSLVLLTEADDPLPPRLMLQIDGVGSFLLLRAAEISIGPVSSSPSPDVGLLTDLHTPTIRIRRTDDDYFLTSELPVQVNDRATRQSLLSGDDRLVLSPHCRLRFRVPHPASTTALLELSVGRLARADVRQCLLVAGDVVIGPGATSHVQTAQLTQPLVLHLIDGQLRCRGPLACTVDGTAWPADRGLPLDQPVQIGPLRLALKSA